MASQTLVYEQVHQGVHWWLQQALSLNPRDTYAWLLAQTYRLSPTLCQFLLRIKKRQEIDPLTIPPFVDLKQV